MLVKYVRLFSDAKPPERASSGAVGFDVYAYHVVDKHTREECGILPVVLEPGASVLLGAGIAFAVPLFVDCQVRPRSGLASEYDVELFNAPGIVDPDFRGEIGILLWNRGTKPFTIKKGMRVAQLIFTEVKIPHFTQVEELPPTLRNTGGFGSTGMQEITLGETEYLTEQKKWDWHFMRMAISAAFLSNCLRGAERKPDGSYKRDHEGRYLGATRRFGCMIAKGRNVIAQGFNTRTIECSEESGCIRERERIPSGTANDKGCLHAEVVAIQNYAHTGGTSLAGATVYVNSEPCVMCAKLLLGCGISAVVVPEGIYPTNGLPLLIDAGIEVRNISI